MLWKRAAGKVMNGAVYAGAVSRSSAVRVRYCACRECMSVRLWCENRGVEIRLSVESGEMRVGRRGVRAQGCLM